MSTKSFLLNGWVGAAAVVVLAVVFVFAWPSRPEAPAETETSTNSVMIQSVENLPVRSEDVTYHKDIVGYYAAPVTKRIYPGVVMIHEWWGLNDHIKEMADKLASEGYQVLAVDLYGVPAATTREEAMALRNSVSKDETTENLMAAVQYLRDRGAYAVGSLGWCYGGGKSLELSLSGTPLDATVIYYGTVTDDEEALSQIDWPVLGIFGAEDASISVESVEAFDAALDRAGVENSIHIYPGVGHAFANPSGQNYAGEETVDAWAKTVRFLKDALYK